MLDSKANSGQFAEIWLAEIWLAEIWQNYKRNINIWVDIAIEFSVAFISFEWAVLHTHKQVGPSGNIKKSPVCQH